FSWVDGSYAGKQGKARNVGVIAVAIFEEGAPPVEQEQIIVGESNRRYDYRQDLDASAPRHSAPGRVANVDRSRGHSAKAEKKMAPPPADEAPATATASGGAAGPAPRSAPAPQRESLNEE